MGFIFKSDHKQLRDTLVEYNLLVDKLENALSKEYSDYIEKTVRLLEIELDDLALLIKLLFNKLNEKDNRLDKLKLDEMNWRFKRCPIPAYSSLFELSSYYYSQFYIRDDFGSNDDIELNASDEYYEEILDHILTWVNRYKLYRIKNNPSKEDIARYNEKMVKSLKRHFLTVPFASDDRILNLVKHIYSISRDFQKYHAKKEIMFLMNRGYTIKPSRTRSKMFSERSKYKEYTPNGEEKYLFFYTLS